MRRRELISLLGGAAAWPLGARAQQVVIPVVAVVHGGFSDASARYTASFRKGLSETGYIERQNVMVEYHWLEGQYDRLPSVMADLVRRRVAVIATPGGTATALAAKAVTTAVPIIFGVSEDPVRLGLVASLARPGGNLTGVNVFSGELVAKRLERLRELVPAAARVAVLVNPAEAVSTETTVRDVEAAARSIGLQIQVFKASTSREIDAAFATLVRDRPDAFFVGSDPFFVTRRMQLTHLASRHAVPTIYSVRDYADVGGLMSYGASLTDAYRQMGVYCGRILKGSKPADLPVVQSSKLELVINAQAARTLGLTVPASLLSIADEVIE
jgi:putative ABC transport system substrate-binding protein